MQDVLHQVDVAGVAKAEVGVSVDVGNGEGRLKAAHLNEIAPRMEHLMVALGDDARERSAKQGSARENSIAASMLHTGCSSASGRVPSFGGK